VYRNRIIPEHPDTAHAIAGLEIPNWTKLLDLSARCHDLTGLGYLGVDVVLDAHYGPLMLELNARPGISIQIANRAGLLDRLRETERWLDAQPTVPKVEERVAFARDAFAEPGSRYAAARSG
jgi:hypothetical protein